MTDKDAEPERAPKKKKKKRPASDSQAAPTQGTPPSEERKPLPGAGTPEGIKLRETNAAFEAGNYVRVRELLAELGSASDPHVRDAVRDLERRVSVDPIQIGFLVVCLVAFLIITYTYVLS